MAGGLVAALIAGAISLRIGEARSEQFINDMLMVVGNQASADVAAGIRLGDAARIRSAIEQLQSIRRLHHAALVDGRNTIVEATSRSLLGKTLQNTPLADAAMLVVQTRTTGSPRRTVAAGSLYYSSPVGIAERATAALTNVDDFVLLLSYDHGALLQAERATAVNQALMTAVTVLLLSIAAWLMLERRLFRRINTLVEMSRRIGSGDMRQPLEITGNDELATLGRALEQMRENLHQNRQALQNYSEELAVANATIEAERLSLADRVRERTRELTEANAELAEARDEAEAASRAKSAFLATVSHEIRTPMNGVLGAMELLGRTDLDEKRAALLHTAETSARSLLGLLNDILDMAKIEAGHIDVVERPTAIRALVRQVIGTHAPTAVSRHTHLSGTVADDVPEWVCADALRLQQVLGNIVSNAVKFTRNGTVTLRVSVAAQDDERVQLVFCVQDNGRGISPESMTRLFKPFEQGSGRFARAAGGTGLGLAICRGLVERMGGEIRLDSEPAVGTDATVTLWFEVTEAPEQPDVAAEDTDEAAIRSLLDARNRRGGHALRALVVDDHPVNRMLQLRQLEQLGIDAAYAADGVDAMEQLRHDTFDLVLTDCEMPNMDGFQLALAIRQSGDALAGIPIIGCTAHALPEVASYCRECGMNDVLTKPMRLDELATAVHKVLPGSETRRVPIEPAGLQSTSDVLDQAQLDRLTGGDQSLQQTLMQSFIRDHAQAISDLREAAAKEDWKACRSLAHRGKGACGVFGAMALRDAFEALESIAGNDEYSREELSAAIDTVGREGERLHQELTLVA